MTSAESKTETNEANGGEKTASEPEPKVTITQAIQQVMKSAGRSLTIPEVHEAIVQQDLYRFRADDPVHIVRNEIRRHCLGLDFASASPNKLFQLTGDGRYFVLETPILKRPAVAKKSASKKDRKELAELRQHYEAYLVQFRNRVLDELRRLGPKQFERFCRNLLGAYGFRNVKVTRFIRDGGIDGYGRLKVGFDYFNVAFQCKRRTRGNVGRPEISQFRGDIQGQYEMGVFFTTAKFTPEAKGYSLRRGAVPITLIDGPTILEIMLEKNFGVEAEQLPVYGLALDLALAE